MDCLDSDRSSWEEAPAHWSSPPARPPLPLSARAPATQLPFSSAFASHSHIVERLRTHLFVVRGVDERREVERGDGEGVVDPDAAWIVCLDEQRVEVVDQFRKRRWRYLLLVSNACTKQKRRKQGRGAHSAFDFEWERRVELRQFPGRVVALNPTTQCQPSCWVHEQQVGTRVCLPDDLLGHVKGGVACDALAERSTGRRRTKVVRAYGRRVVRARRRSCSCGRHAETLASQGMMERNEQRRHGGKAGLLHREIPAQHAPSHASTGPTLWPPAPPHLLPTCPPTSLVIITKLTLTETVHHTPGTAARWK
ncbi:hypothetical protein L1887_57926 [Cichorium endivia]|nr:hypothetical protein L1887_57926 [Cichorium endivia]